MLIFLVEYCVHMCEPAAQCRVRISPSPGLATLLLGTYYQYYQQYRGAGSQEPSWCTQVIFIKEFGCLALHFWKLCNAEFLIFQPANELLQASSFSRPSRAVLQSSIAEQYCGWSRILQDSTELGCPESPVVKVTKAIVSLAKVEQSRANSSWSQI